MEYLDELEKEIISKHKNDKEQMNFIFSNEKNIIVTAPAGCGKTTAMVSKIAREISVGHIPSNKKILAMTFSVNAAIRIKDSLKKLIPDVITNSDYFLSKIDVANYHNFSMRILFKYGYILNEKFKEISTFKVINHNSSMLDSLISKDNLDKIKKFNDYVRLIKKKDIEENINDYWNVINDFLIPQGFITYDGILVASIKLLENVQISSFYKKFYKMIIIDEFQDTNCLGYMLIEKLIGNNRIVFLGDDVQKIYGFLGAVDNIFDLVSHNHKVVHYVFKNNYRFQNNERMKQIDLLVRDYATNYTNSSNKASIFLKVLCNDEDEDLFVVEGINKIKSNSNDSIAILVRSAYLGNTLVKTLNDEQIKYFNALYKDDDQELISFYDISLEEYSNLVCGSPTKRNLNNCLESIKCKINKIYSDENRKYIFESLYKLLQIMFKESIKNSSNLNDRNQYILYILSNKGLNRMMEFLEESVILATIHSAKGLEWDYVILPRMNSYLFPTSHLCKQCAIKKSYNREKTLCEFLFKSDMKTGFTDEINVLYVAITRAKRNVFMTANLAPNIYGYAKKLNCLVNLHGIKKQNYEWNDVI